MRSVTDKPLRVDANADWTLPEALRILTDSVNFTRQGQLAVRGVKPKSTTRPRIRVPGSERGPVPEPTKDSSRAGASLPDKRQEYAASHDQNDSRPLQRR